MGMCVCLFVTVCRVYIYIYIYIYMYSFKGPFLTELCCANSTRRINFGPMWGWPPERRTGRSHDRWRNFCLINGSEAD